MKALLIKDWLILFKQGRLNVVILIFFAVLGAISTGNSFLTFFSVVFMSMLTVTTMGLDEQCHFEALAEQFPISRRTRVMEKYLFGFLNALVGIMVNCVVQLAVHQDLEILENLIPLLLIVGLIYPMFNLPFIFKLGVAKARIWYLAAMVMVMAMIGGVSSLITEGVFQIFNVTLWAAVGISVILFLVSMVISIGVYERREL